MKARRCRRTAAICLMILTFVGLFAGCGVKPEDGRVVLRLDDERVYYDYYRYVYQNARDDMAGDDKTYFDSHPGAADALKAVVLDTLLSYRAVQRLAEAYSVSVSEEEQKAVEEAIGEQRRSMGDDAFAAMLTEAHLTEYSLRYVQILSALRTDLYDTLTAEENGIILCGDEVLEADFPQSYRRIRYLYLAAGEGKEALASELAGRAASGEDFGGLIAEYGENDLMEGLIETGYYYTLGQIDPAVAEAVEALSEGEISGVLSLTGGFFLIQRLTPERAFFDSHREEFRDMYRARIFNEMLNAEKDKIKVKETDLYRSLTPDSVI